MFSRLITFFTAAMLCFSVATAQKSGTDAKKIKTEQQRAKKEIREKTQRLETNKREIKKQKSALRALDKEIGARDNEIGELEAHMADLNAGVTTTHAQIDSLTAEIAALRLSYGRLLRSMQTFQPATSPLSYLLGSKSMTDFFDRMRYIRRLRAYRLRREAELGEKARQLGLQREELTKMIDERSATLTRLTDNRAQLQSKKAQADKLVSRLERQGVDLKTDIARRQKRLAQLENELNRIIEADRRAREERARKEAEAKKKAAAKKEKETPKQKEQPSPTPKKEAPTQMAEADRKLSGDFESNRGRLLFPVAGSYRVVRGFGRGQYSSKVQTSHVGIDIEVARGAQARAIFEGVVTNVSHLEGFNTIVVVRHGSYLTVYVNLQNVGVRAGQTVKAGQTIGTVAPDEDGGSKSVLQFGIRKERQELNPLEWVK